MIKIYNVTIRYIKLETVPKRSQGSTTKTQMTAEQQQSLSDLGESP